MDELNELKNVTGETTCIYSITRLRSQPKHTLPFEKKLSLRPENPIS